MSWANVTYIFSPSTVIKSSEVNQNFDDLVRFVNVGMPSKTVVAFFGLIGEIEEGWIICDGTSGSPDLRGRTIVGAGQGAGLTNRVLNEAGGAETHTNPITAAGQLARVAGDHGSSGFDIGGYYTVDHNHGGATGAGSSMQPFRVLTYIMKT